MLFGINTFLFSSPFTNESTQWFPMFKEWGFDGIEIGVENVTDFDAAFVRAELDRHGLRADVVCAAMGAGRDPRGTPDEQAAGMAYLNSVLDIMPTLGATILAGPLYSAVGRAEQTSPDEYQRQWNLVVGHLRTLASRAESMGLRLAVEPLNRFETDFINTGEQGLRLVEAVGSPALGLHLDTFHMNIEEKKLPNVIRQAGDKLWHLHTCGNDRGTPGNDHSDWPGIAAALHEIGYSGYATIESFTVEVKAIAKAAAIWRQIEPTREEIAVKGVQFLRGLLA
ncbi:MAG: sugar phosphate isomerase/epimerase [Cytophagaceae bacterium]|nr:sugar phosphate isomerase/epimerase [Cytophagaceae bacterium]